MSARVGNNLECDHGSFKNPGGTALNADGVRVAGYVVFRKGFNAQGQVRLSGANVSIDIMSDESTFTNLGGTAILAEGVSVKGAVLLGPNLSAQGVVNLAQAQIGGDVQCVDSLFGPVVAQGATVRGNFWWFKIREPGSSKLDLIHAQVRGVVDDEASWPSPGNLRLDGLKYSRVPGKVTDAVTRLRWLARLDRFSLQPYQQLAKALSEAGDARGARKVLFEMECVRRKKEDRTFAARWWSWVLRWTIGYGLLPKQAFAWLFLLVGLGYLWTNIAFSKGIIVPNGERAYAAFVKGGAPPPYYPHFHALVYSVENSFPFVNLAVKDRWRPDESVHFLTFRMAFQVWIWFQVIAGWTLATLFVAGLTGIVRAETG